MYKAIFLPLLITLSLHAVLVLIFVAPWPGSEPVVKKVTPNFVKAELVTLEKPKPKPKAKKKVTKPKPKPVAKPAPKKKAAPKKQAVAKNEADSKQKAKERELAKQREREKQQALERQREADRKQREQQQRERELAEAMEQEALQEQADSDAALANSYIALIADRIQSRWSRPPSARNNMEAELLLQLVPTGEVVGVAIVKSSGNSAFDRSAENAVKDVERFPELQQLPPRVFEQYFRRLRLKFRPEDLRR